MGIKSFLILITLGIFLQDCKAPHYDVVNNNTAFCAAAPNTCDWMHDIIMARPDASLSDICLPGSHDAAMYIAQHCTAFTNHGNTQTQYLTMKNQLEAGLRIYDLRPVYYQGEFYTEHSTRCNGLGCKGDMMKNILRDTRAFLDAHSELVIFELSHFCNSSPTDTAFLALLNETLGDRIYREPEMRDKKKLFINRALKPILGDGSKGKVLLILHGVESTAENRAKGWFAGNTIQMTGGWSNDNHYPDLREHQLQRFAAYKGNGDELYQLAWQITQHDAQAVRGAFDPNSPTTIRKSAVKANAQLPLFLDSLITSGAIHKDKIPNLIWDDLGDTMVTHQCIRLSRIGTE
ncbi:MAG: hypothetical protein JWO03_2906 [Bacteroidetes bacterium]|nr:hypothetical protein [Bacteroidota bacterium]